MPPSIRSPFDLCRLSVTSVHFLLTCALSFHKQAVWCAHEHTDIVTKSSNAPVKWRKLALVNHADRRSTKIFDAFEHSAPDHGARATHHIAGCELTGQLIAKGARANWRTAATSVQAVDQSDAMACCRVRIDLNARQARALTWSTTNWPIVSFCGDVETSVSVGRGIALAGTMVFDSTGGW